MRFVATKTPEQQSYLTLHRTHHLLIRQQTLVINAIRAHLAGFGIVAPVRRKGVEDLLRVVADPKGKRVPKIARACLAALGADLVFGRLWQSTACRDVIAALSAERGFDFDVERAIYLTVLHRLMVSGSDRHASRWREALRIPGVENLTLDQVYKAMRWLGEDIAGSGPGAEGRHTTDVIEEQLYRHRQELFGEVSVAQHRASPVMLA
jgi:hypothetical protein